MRIPIIRGVIERRILANFRVDPEAIAKTLPPPFRPVRVEGLAVAGICLIRLAGIRPLGLPSWLGVGSENAAHRVAVEWDTPSGPRTGVYIPRRDTNSRLNALVGGRVFPGEHHYSPFEVEESDPHYFVRMTCRDDETAVLVRGERVERFPDDSVFGSLEAASKFFEGGSLGYSPRRGQGCYDGLELRTGSWSVEPLAVDEVESSFFSDTRWFPPGTVTFDHALLMRDIPHEWHGRETLRGPSPTSEG